MIVSPQPPGCIILDFIDGIEQVMRQPVIANGAVVALDIGVLLRLAMLDKLQLDFALLMPCSRHKAVTGVPASAWVNIASIWLSLNLDFFIQNLLHIVYEEIPLMNSINLWGDYQ